jgi:formiminotetrahydrofolate cyclodeaminase
MTGKLIDLVTKTLLEKFGAGEHKPGSGSASAFQGLLSAQLLITVIDLTSYPARKKNYKEKLNELLSIREDIQSRLYPSVERLFQEDSDLFDRVIGLRRERDGIDRNKDWKLYRQKVAAAEDALREATELPINIAQNCYELGKYAGTVFDYGFKSARGDSGVALHCAISGMGSCLSVIELNLSKLPADAWMAKIRQQKAILKKQYTELSNMGTERLAVLEKEAEENWELKHTFEMYSRGNLGQTIRTDEDIENLVRNFQNKLWVNRDKM